MEETEDVTGAVLFLTSDDAAFITGQAIVVDGVNIALDRSAFTVHSRGVGPRDGTLASS
jgi:enoyl-[acyl-carrier-protein] reductase (NADH)